VLSSVAAPAACAARAQARRTARPARHRRRSVPRPRRDRVPPPRGRGRWRSARGRRAAALAGSSRARGARRGRGRCAGGRLLGGPVSSERSSIRWRSASPPTQAWISDGATVCQCRLDTSTTSGLRFRSPGRFGRDRVRAADRRGAGGWAPAAARRLAQGRKCLTDPSHRLYSGVVVLATRLDPRASASSSSPRLRGRRPRTKLGLIEEGRGQERR
jgi:hypothetical protein